MPLGRSGAERSSAADLHKKPLIHIRHPSSHRVDCLRLAKAQMPSASAMGFR